MRRYKVFRRFNCTSRGNRYNRAMSFNKWSMYHGDDVMQLFNLMFEYMRSINKNFLDIDDYNIMLKDFMKHVYDYSYKKGT